MAALESRRRLGVPEHRLLHQFAWLELHVLAGRNPYHVGRLVGVAADAGFPRHDLAHATVAPNKSEVTRTHGRLP